MPMQNFILVRIKYRVHYRVHFLHKLCQTFDKIKTHTKKTETKLKIELK